MKWRPKVTVNHNHPQVTLPAKQCVNKCRLSPQSNKSEKGKRLFHAHPNKCPHCRIAVNQVQGSGKCLTKRNTYPQQERNMPDVGDIVYIENVSGLHTQPRHHQLNLFRKCFVQLFCDSAIKQDFKQKIHQLSPMC